MKIFVVCILLLVLFSCGDDGPNCLGDMVLPVIISPYKPFYYVGDTITIESKFHRRMFDKKTEKFFDAGNYNFIQQLDMETIDTSNGPWKGSQVKEFSDYIKMDSSRMNYLFVENNVFIAGDYNINNDTLSSSNKCNS